MRPRNADNPFVLSRPIGRQVAAKSRLSNSRSNPSNFEKMGSPEGVRIPVKFKGVSAKQAARMQDVVARRTHDTAQALELSKMYNDYIKLETKYTESMKKLGESLLKNEIAVEEAMAAYQKGLHELNLARQKAGLDVAAENALGTAAQQKFEQQKQQKLIATNYQTPFTAGAMPGSTNRTLSIGAQRVR